MGIMTEVILCANRNVSHWDVVEEGTYVVADSSRGTASLKEDIESQIKHMIECYTEDGYIDDAEQLKNFKVEIIDEDEYKIFIKDFEVEFQG